MSGHIGIIASDMSRFTLFHVCMTQMQHPTGTGVLWKLTGDRIAGRNAVVRDALDAGSEWLLFLDDDHVFPRDVLLRLLAREVPVAAALYVQRARPFMPIAYSDKDEATGAYTPLRLKEMPEGELVPVRACGTGGMLIRSEVFHALPEPWFEYGAASEDLIFCDRLHELGIPMAVDTGVRMGHLSLSSVWPSYLDGAWSIGFQLADGFSLFAEVEEDEPQ